MDSSRGARRRSCSLPPPPRAAALAHRGERSRSSSPSASLARTLPPPSRAAPQTWAGGMSLSRFSGSAPARAPPSSSSPSVQLPANPRRQHPLEPRSPLLARSSLDDEYLAALLADQEREPKAVQEAELRRLEEYLAALQADQEIELKSVQEAELRRLEEAAAREAAIEKQKQEEKEERRKQLEEEEAELRRLEEAAAREAAIEKQKQEEKEERRKQLEEEDGTAKTVSPPNFVAANKEDGFPRFRDGISSKKNGESSSSAGLPAQDQQGRNVQEDPLLPPLSSDQRRSVDYRHQHSRTSFNPNADTSEASSSVSLDIEAGTARGRRARTRRRNGNSSGRNERGSDEDNTSREILRENKDRCKRFSMTIVMLFVLHGVLLLIKWGLLETMKGRETAIIWIEVACWLTLSSLYIWVTAKLDKCYGCVRTGKGNRLNAFMHMATYGVCYGFDHTPMGNEGLNAAVVSHVVAFVIELFGTLAIQKILKSDNSPDLPEGGC